MNKKSINFIIEILEKEYEEVKCTLDYHSPLELLIATQLSAQCTDKRVNIVTPELFKKYKNVIEFKNANIIDVEKIIKSTGFFRNKSKNIIACCNLINNEFNGNVPDNINDLVKLPGVGRKTANVVLSEIFNVPGIIVDTHTKRLSNRIGLTNESEPKLIEKDLMKIIPKNIWSDFSHRLVYHGRRVCNARNPKCDICKLNNYCDYYKKEH